MPGRLGRQNTTLTFQEIKGDDIHRDGNTWFYFRFEETMMRKCVSHGDHPQATIGKKTY